MCGFLCLLQLRHIYETVNTRRSVKDIQGHSGDHYRVRTPGGAAEVMAAKGSVANIRKKLLSKLSTSDDRRINSAAKRRTTDTSKWTDAVGEFTTTTKKDWPLHHQTILVINVYMFFFKFFYKNEFLTFFNFFPNVFLFK